MAFKLCVRGPLSTKKESLGFRDGKNAFRRGVITMAPTCCLSETLFIVICMGYLVWIVMTFTQFCTINWII